MKDKKMIGEMLISEGLIDEATLRKAIEYQKHNGLRLGESLIQLGFLTEIQVLKTVSKQLNISLVTDIKEINLDKKLIDKVPAHTLRTHKFIPISINEAGTVTVICNDIYNTNIKDICENIYGAETNLILSEVEIIMYMINEYEREKEHAESLNRIRSGITSLVLIYDLNAKETSATASEVNYILLEAFRKRASDIHLIQEEHHASIYFRIDGVLQLIHTYPLNLSGPLVSRVKNMGGMLSTEKRRSQDGGFKAIADGITVDMRISSMPSIYGESVVIRLLDHRYIDALDIENLGFSPHNKDRFLSLLNNPNGIVAVTGPTGSGKSSTNYVALRRLNTGNKSIHSIEDPVEYKVKGIVATQINEKAGVTFASVLRTLVRQDPDVIYIGEIRDTETALMAMNASNTGQFILTTLHTNDSVSAISRFFNLGVKPYQLIDAFLGATAQVLVRKICVECNNDGCPKCNNTGYYGRIPLQEVMMFSPNMKDILTSPDNLNLNELRKIAFKEGLIPMFEDGMEKVRQGITTEEEVIKAARKNH